VSLPVWHNHFKFLENIHSFGYSRKTRLNLIGITSQPTFQVSASLRQLSHAFEVPVN
jgi:hypothetical protein